MEKGYLKIPHQYDPRRVYSQYGTDWQERVNFDRLRRERLQRVRDKMDEHDLGALILFDGNNIRYVTGYYPGNWKFHEVIQENMYFAVETYSGRPGVQQAVRLEENLVVTKDGPQVFTLFPFEEEMLK